MLASFVGPDAKAAFISPEKAKRCAVPGHGIGDHHLEATSEKDDHPAGKLCRRGPY